MITLFQEEIYLVICAVLGIGLPGAFELIGIPVSKPGISRQQALLNTIVQCEHRKWQLDLQHFVHFSHIGCVLCGTHLFCGILFGFVFTLVYFVCLSHWL